ncbi:claspin-like [Prorops nasuta]|uniref:claspin-like n=1 Tax=Prorops nasuta TaxID=863751 RepID=UPI0034CEC28F
MLQSAEADNSSDFKQNNNISDVPKKELLPSFKTLLDSDSEEEGGPSTPPPMKSQFSEVEEKQFPKKSKIKHKKSSLRASKEEAMRQIHSETQRLIRQSEISLPYHRPKQRTLQEFLSRKKLAPVLPNAPTTAIKLKIASEIVSKALEEREKEAELFYKSSDSEEEEAKEEPNVDEEMALEGFESRNTHETSKEAINVVSRKLFENDSNDASYLKSVKNSKINTENENDYNNTNLIETLVDQVENPKSNILEILENPVTDTVNEVIPEECFSNSCSSTDKEVSAEATNII